MRIKDVKVAVLATGPWPTPVPNDYEWLLVRVDTDEAITGIGETRAGSRTEKAIGEAKPRLLGEDPFNINRIHGLVGEGGSGVEIACWDIMGKALGVPLHRLFGGRYRDKVRMYADSGGPVGWGIGSLNPEAFARRARTVLSKGFDAMKIDVDTPAHGRFGFNGCVEEEELALMERQVKATRDVIGYEMPLAVDCHGKYSPTTAIRIAERLAKFGLWWIEDPVPSQNVEALLEVKAHTNLPISAGELFATRFDFREVIETRAISILGPDSITTGGLAEFRRIGELAELYYVPLAPHNMTTPIATMATAHICAALPNFIALEHHFQDFEWWDGLLKGGPLIDRGYIAVPDKPGIGLELDEREALKHLKRGSIF